MDINFRLSKVILEFLIGHRCREFVFCPGARNSPFIRTLFFLSEHYPPSSLRIRSHFDERGTGFYALGLIKGSQHPTAVITTSGTAVANLYPAMVEAFHSDLPLIAITADRPAHLHYISSNQTIVQKDFFKSFTRGSYMVEDYSTFNSTMKKKLIRDLTDSLSPNLPQGPTHINCPFDEPLIPTEADPYPVKEATPALSVSKIEDEKTNSYSTNNREVNSLTDLIDMIKSSRSGLVILGELRQAINYDEVYSSINYLKERGWYILPEINSGIRHRLFSDSAGSGRVLTHYHYLLENKKVYDYPIDTILHLGGRLLSKNLSTFLQSRSGKTYIHVDNTSHDYNPDGTVTQHIHLSPSDFCSKLLQSIDQYQLNNLEEHIQTTLNLEKYSTLGKIDLKLNEFTKEYPFKGFNELEAARILAEFSCGLLDQGEKCGIFIGNSMPIRDLNAMGGYLGFIQVYSNRGASGIDGLIATAAGIAAGNKSNSQDRSRFYTVIGDLSALHDINSLQLLKSDGGNHSSTLIVINNREGTIFRHLPIAKVMDNYSDKDRFYYRHKIDFSGFAASMSLPYQKITSAEGFRKALEENHDSPHSCFLEVQVDPKVNWEEHSRFSRDIMAMINHLLEQKL